MRSDSELVRQALAGRHDAYGELVRRYERAVFAAAGAILRDWHDVQDAAQEAFLLAYRRLGQLRDKGLFGQWVVRIARTQALTLLRKARRAVSLEETVGEVADVTNHKVDARTGELLQAVMKLPTAQQQAVLMRFFGGHSVGEIAEITAQPVGSVTSQLSRAYQNLRTLIGERET